MDILQALADNATLIFTGIASGFALVGSFVVARKYQALGGGEAQAKLNATYRELNEAFEDRIGQLTVTLSERNVEITMLRREVMALRDEVAVLSKALIATDKRADEAEAREP